MTDAQTLARLKALCRRHLAKSDILTPVGLQSLYDAQTLDEFRHRLHAHPTPNSFSLWDIITAIPEKKGIVKPILVWVGIIGTAFAARIQTGGWSPKRLLKDKGELFAEDARAIVPRVAFSTDKDLDVVLSHLLPRSSTAAAAPPMPPESWPLPDAITEQIISYLPIKDMNGLERSSRFFRAIARPQKLRQSIANNYELTVREMLESDPIAALERGHITYHKQSFYMSAFQYAYARGDSRMLRLMKEALLKAGKAREMAEQILEIDSRPELKFNLDAVKAAYQEFINYQAIDNVDWNEEESDRLWQATGIPVCDLPAGILRFICDENPTTSFRKMTKEKALAYMQDLMKEGNLTYQAEVTDKFHELIDTGKLGTDFSIYKVANVIKIPERMRGRRSAPGGCKTFLKGLDSYMEAHNQLVEELKEELVTILQSSQSPQL